MASFRLTCSSTAWWFFQVKTYPSSVNLFSLSVPSHKGRVFLSTQVTAPPPAYSGKVNPGDAGIQGTSGSRGPALPSPPTESPWAPRGCSCPSLLQPGHRGPPIRQEWEWTHSPNIPIYERAAPSQARLTQTKPTFTEPWTVQMAWGWSYSSGNQA